MTPTRGLSALAVVTLVVCSAAAGAVVPRAPWLAYGRTADAQNASPTPVAVAAAKAMHGVWESKVGGMITAQPLYAPNVKVGGRTRQLLVVATAANVVVALELGTGNIVWRRSLGPTPPQVCGGTGGVESTPVIDAAAHRLYVIGGNGRLVALALATGRPIARWSVQIIKRTNVEVVWSALRIAAGSIYVPVSSWCDKGDSAGAWDGRLVRVSTKTHRILETFDVVPGPANGGGIWGPGGVSVDPSDGTVWTATANAVVYKGKNLQEAVPLAERVVHLTPGLKVLGSVVQPDSNPSVLGDQGFGATPVLFKPTGCPAMLAVNSKDSYTYVWRRAALTSAPVLRMKLGASGPPTPSTRSRPGSRRHGRSSSTGLRSRAATARTERSASACSGTAASSSPGA